MIATFEWDTATVLTVILAPLCLILIGIMFVLWQRINELKNDLTTATKKAEEIMQKDNEIKRQEQQIGELRAKLQKCEADLYTAAIEKMRIPRPEIPPEPPLEL